MKRRIAAISGIIGLGLLLNTGLALSQDEPEDKALSSVAPQEKNESDMQWVWGEVISVDTQNKTLALKYLDYDMDEEKELLIIADNLTSYENAKSLEEIRAKDSVSIDYISVAGKNTARSISLEKAEAVDFQSPVAR
ncbi:MAG: hypothetical protein PHV58_00385 [Candidatus Omnitrophica bacterium]|nr:hypothetical protein [Candidatus Omnitrophota bacterium]MDD5661793.1 hypothetical protein [Candidatus Omnitrophota bacterium]